MSHASVPRARSLASAILRLLSVPASLAVGGLLLAAPASAQEKPSAQATIMDVAVEDGALTARILWPETGVPASVQVVSYDGLGKASARIEVAPKPNEMSVVQLPSSALQAPWETGWGQKLTVEDGTGQTIATQPYDVSLSCDGSGGDDERCELVAYPSPGTNSGVIRLSEDLDQAIEQLKPADGGEFNVVEKVSAAYPELRGEALVYGDQLARLQRPGPCQCSWASTFNRSPSLAQSKWRRPSSLLKMEGDNGPGAAHWLHAWAYGRFLSSVHEISDSVGGTSTLNLRLSCSQLLYIIDKWVIIFRPDGTSQVVHIYQPVYGSCTAPCRATFDHIGRYTGRTTEAAQQQPGNRGIAQESGTYSVDSVTLTNQSTAGNNWFDNTTYRTVVGYSSTSKVSTYGYARAVGRWNSANASVRNGYAMAIHGSASCVFPNEAAAWGFGTTQGGAHEASLKSSIRNFFWQWNIPVNP